MEQDFEKGIALLTECADSGDVIACYRLGKIYLESEIMPQNLDKAEKYLLLAEDNEYTQYALAKLYLRNVFTYQKCFAILKQAVLVIHFS